MHFHQKAVMARLLEKSCAICSKTFHSKNIRQIYCSNACNRKALKRRGYKPNPIIIQSWRDRIKESFNAYKKSIGCRICGYNRYGGALVFHHIIPKDKIRKIISTDFYYKTDHWYIESPKCILICQNCHSEVHDMLLIDPTNYLTIINRNR